MYIWERLGHVFAMVLEKLPAEDVSWMYCDPYLANTTDSITDNIQPVNVNQTLMHGANVQQN